jgi:hypothetical protein
MLLCALLDLLLLLLFLLRTTHCERRRFASDAAGAAASESSFCSGWCRHLSGHCCWQLQQTSPGELNLQI